MNRLAFSCFACFFVRIIKTRIEYVFFKIQGTVNSMEQNTRAFYSIDIQEFHVNKNLDVIHVVE
jgi:hypothetical protein